ncbi:MAG TPA: SDR family oxidoreductase [Polyangiaceae bacterium]|nr:SDR family oxidoreductase [Polyangiaceae bacterium]
MELGLKGKVAVISGGSVGIGLAVAEALAEEGVQLVLCARNEPRVKECAAAIEGRYGVRAIGIGADVAQASGVQSVLARTAEVFDGADILINNAGTGSNETIQEAPDEKWQYYWDLHTMAAVRLSRGLIPLMKKRGGGVIINNASICAKQPLGYEPIYNVTKAALMMFSKCLSNEVITDNIRVNCVNPGLVLTPDWKKTARELTASSGGDWQGYLDDIAKKNAPIGRFASPEELAKFFVFLCSPCSSYCVGSTFYVDGGWLNGLA